MALAKLLTKIENGAPWPKDVLSSRAHPLCKDPDNVVSPYSWRFLLLTSTLYRMWAKTKLRHLSSWTKTWALPEIFGGIEGLGAEDA
eukprot:8672100-Karenia_brevis.AAC.1